MQIKTIGLYAQTSFIHFHGGSRESPAFKMEANQINLPRQKVIDLRVECPLQDTLGRVCQQILVGLQYLWGHCDLLLRGKGKNQTFWEKVFIKHPLKLGISVPE